jgi:hypothetical protein
VAVGHLDTPTGPAVFAGLDELERGHRVEVRRADGRVAVHTVDAVRSYEKTHFPHREVYGARGRPELHPVVFAHLTQIREPRPQPGPLNPTIRFLTCWTGAPDPARSLPPAAHIPLTSVTHSPVRPARGSSTAEHQRLIPPPGAPS